MAPRFQRPRLLDRLMRLDSLSALPDLLVRLPQRIITSVVVNSADALEALPPTETTPVMTARASQRAVPLCSLAVVTAVIVAIVEQLPTMMARASPRVAPLPSPEVATPLVAPSSRKAESQPVVLGSASAVRTLLAVTVEVLEAVATVVVAVVASAAATVVVSAAVTDLPVETRTTTDLVLTLVASETSVAAIRLASEDH